MDRTWVRRWRYEMEATPTKPGVWRLKEGGHYIRGRTLDPRTGRQHEVAMPLPDATASQAYAELHRRLEEIRSFGVTAARPRTRFAEYAALVFERKVTRGKIKSAKTRLTWQTTLTRHLLPRFGEYYVDAITRAEIERWLDEGAKRVAEGEYTATTVNGWFAIMRTILNQATGELELSRNPIEGVTPLDLTGTRYYTEEEPNALTIEELNMFLNAMHDRFPQHFAMVALGFATGLRPSSLRPLRHKGPTPDVLWKERALLVRRSQTVQNEVMECTKTKRYQRLALPDELMLILKVHVDALPPGPMSDSDLLFPSTTGGFRSSEVLHKPFAEVAKLIGLRKKITPRGMRRTFQDVARAASVADVVTRSISGHATESMQLHYSSVGEDEQRASLRRMIALAGVTKVLPAPEPAPVIEVVEGASTDANDAELN